MSTGYACTFFEILPGKWYYALQTRPSYQDGWEDMVSAKEAVVYGPFASEDAGWTHLHRNFANPGGGTRETYERLKANPKSLEYFKSLSKLAKSPFERRGLY